MHRYVKRKAILQHIESQTHIYHLKQMASHTSHTQQVVKILNKIKSQALQNKKSSAKKLY